METSTRGLQKALLLNTTAFTVCFASWMINGVLVTFLVDNQIFNWDPGQVGLLFGIPVLTGSLLRLPAGMLTDRFGGKPVFTSLLFLCAIPMSLLSRADSFAAFALCSFGLGMAGSSFSIGVAFTSVWSPPRLQGTALGIFGAGTLGAALTTLLAPSLLNRLTEGGKNLEAWRYLPIYYALMLVAVGIIFLIFSENRKPVGPPKSMGVMLRPLRYMRVWRFGMYYFLVFGCFVAFSQWLVPYFVNVYYLPLVTAGLFAAVFSLPSALSRALGGVLADKFGGRRIMYWVLGWSIVLTLMLMVPNMEIYARGPGVMALRDGVVREVTPNAIVVEERGAASRPGVLRSYPLQAEQNDEEDEGGTVLVLPKKSSWQEAMVKPGQQVKKKELLARGITEIFFQANVWIFAGIVLCLGATWGIGMAAVFKLIPDYFPNEVGVVGGMVGVLGGLGGFVCPILFGYLLEWSGIWTSCWAFTLLLSIFCLISLHYVVQKMMRQKHPADMRALEDQGG